MVTEPPRILVIGSINMDLVVRTPAMPAPGETVLGSDVTTSPGGKGANQAVAAQRLGGMVTMIARVGDDAFGETLKNGLAEEGIDVAYVTVTESTPTGVAFIMVDRQGENSIVVASGANHAVTPDDVYTHEQLFDEHDVLVLQLELPCPTVRAAIDLARRHGLKTLLDPAPAMKQFPDELCCVDVISPNVNEAEILTGKKAVEERDRIDKLVASELIQRGAKNAVLKLGSRGSLVVCADGHMYRVPPYKVEVVDTTAAGDAFTAGLAVSLAQGRGLHESARLANAAGSLACTTLGAQSAMPTAYQVKMLMEDQP
ncbi:MAG: ribokinase [Planctomycetes bacterium]|jgi:ribokinase|nr:ribokinase [Phycisphaerae bacterium]NBB95794.1 ribokinase [Planctomycetota bacterium]